MDLVLVGLAAAHAIALLPARPPPSAMPSSTTEPPPAASTDEPQPEPLPWPPMASPIEKLPPRPAPTWGYSWDEWSPNARVVYLRDSEDANKHLSRLVPGALGFDLEWKPTYVKGGQENPVALVQLANDDTIYLLQISAMKEFPSKLREILEDRSYIKAGVGIQGDTKKLFTDWEVSVRGCADLSLLARTVDGARWKGKYNVSIGLARLIEVYCYRLLGKGKITRSNWEALLRPAQQSYAANDAHAGFTLYKKLMALVDQKDPPDSKYYTFDCVRGYYCEPTGLPWYPVNPKYDPGPPPPPRPRKDHPGRKGKESVREDGGSQEPTDEPEQSDPNVVMQRHESVMKIAHSTWMRQQDAASAQQQDRKRPRNQRRNANAGPQPLQYETTIPPRNFQHFRHRSPNSFQGPNPPPSASPPLESTSPPLHRPPAQRFRPNPARNSAPNQLHTGDGAVIASASNASSIHDRQYPTPPLVGGNSNHARNRRPRKPKVHVPALQPTAQAQA
ncbi:hypothetical protein NMY22_g14340 [Coprinellus aureogranulatus]|nr:hypothetical protein NMY22_g14340 [Coprinellus aureogranulatus]